MQHTFVGRLRRAEDVAHHGRASDRRDHETAVRRIELDVVDSATVGRPRNRAHRGVEVLQGFAGRAARLDVQEVQRQPARRVARDAVSDDLAARIRRHDRRERVRGTAGSQIDERPRHIGARLHAQDTPVGCIRIRLEIEVPVPSLDRRAVTAEVGHPFEAAPVGFLSRPIEHAPGQIVLSLDPGARLRRVDVLEPAVGVGDVDAVKCIAGVASLGRRVRKAGPAVR